jgi:hypothetical protein
MIAVIAILIVLFIIWHTWDQKGEQVMARGYKTSHFHLSHGESKRIFETMTADKMSSESLEMFIMLEDQLLKIEQTSVCSGISRNREASTVSNTIKNSFLGYDFAYHTIHLKQVSEPHKYVNRSIIC